MKVRDLVKQFSDKLEPFLDCDIDEDWNKEIGGKRLISVLEDECFANTDLRVDYSWNYDN